MGQGHSCRVKAISWYNMAPLRVAGIRPHPKSESTAIPDLTRSSVKNPGDRRSRWRGWAGVVAVLGLWQLGWAVDLIPPIGLPSPLEIAIALWQLIDSGELWFHLEATLPRLAAGWVLGAAVAAIAGWAARRWQAVSSIASGVVAAIGSVPAIALLPLLMIWLGAGETSMIATTAFAAFVPGAGAALPTAEQVPGRPVVLIVATLRASLPVAIAVLVAVEMINGGFGLGALVFSAAELYRSDQIVAGCLVLAGLWLGLSYLVRMADRYGAGGRESR